MKRRKKENTDKRQLEANQNITKQYAVSYAMLVYNHIHPKEDVADFGYQMIELMRAIRPRFAVKEADKLLLGKRNKKKKE